MFKKTLVNLYKLRRQNFISETTFRRLKDRKDILGFMLISPEDLVDSIPRPAYVRRLDNFLIKASNNRLDRSLLSEKKDVEGVVSDIAIGGDFEVWENANVVINIRDKEIFRAGRFKIQETRISKNLVLGTVLEIYAKGAV